MYARREAKGLAHGSALERVLALVDEYYGITNQTTEVMQIGKLREMTILTPEGANKGNSNGQVRGKALSATQYEAIDLLVLRGKQKMTKGAIADKLGINPRTLRRWEQDPMFIAEYKRLVVQATTSRMPEILDA